jgi:hypothetical protein
MTADEFYDLVKQMREKQREYIRYRDAYVLRDVKILEHKVDFEIDLHDGMFDNFLNYNKTEQQ